MFSIRQREGGELIKEKKREKWGRCEENLAKMDEEESSGLTAL